LFEDVGCFWQHTANVGGDGAGEAAPERLNGQWMTVDLANVIGVKPVMGRWFTAEEDKTDQQYVAVIGYNTWQRRFGGSRDVLSKKIRIDNEPYQIIGVMPSGFEFVMPEAEHWTPFPDSPLRANSPSRFLLVAGRLKAGVSMSQAQSEVNSIANQLQQELPATNKDWMIRVEPLREFMSTGARPALFTFQGAVAFVLLIACANVAGLLLAQGAAQQKELAVRSALGSSRWRIVRQMLTESLLLSLFGALFGFVVGWAGLRLFMSTIPPMPFMSFIYVDMSVLAFTLVLSLGTGLLFGIIPALQISRPNLMDALRENSRSATATRSRQRLRSIFVVVQVSLALVLLIGAGLTMRSFIGLSNAPPGMNTDNLLTFQIQYPRNEYLPETGAITQAGSSEVHVTPKISLTSEQIRQRLAAIPGVGSATVTGTPPMVGFARNVNFTIEGQPPATRREDILSTQWYSVLSDYFETLEIPLIRGRKIDARDTASGVPVVVINQTMAQRFWAGEDPIGKRIQFDRLYDDVPREIIGVVGNVRQNLSNANPVLQAYIPYPQIRVSQGRQIGEGMQVVTFVMRATIPIEQIVPALGKAVGEVDPTQAIANVRTVNEWVSRQLLGQRIYALLLGIFGGIAVLLAAIGIYGIMAHSVSNRTSEIGVRVALGASRTAILGLILRRGVFLVGIGMVIGIAASLALTRVVRAILFGVRPTDPFTFVLALLGLATVALLACYIPARRALKVDPIIALRYE
jgi:putative ABC transport system permease protein